MTDDEVATGGLSSHDDESRSEGRRTKEPSDPRTTLSKVSKRNKSIQPRGNRDMDRRTSIPRAQPKHHSVDDKSGRGKVSIL